MAAEHLILGIALLSVTVGLYSLMKLFPEQSKTMKKKFSAWICNQMMWRVHLKCARQKQTLFENFDDLNSDGSTPHILEVGVGSGNNFAFFPKRCTLSCLDPNLEHGQYLSRALQQYPGIKMEKFVKGYAENMEEFEDNTFDAVVCTFTLCSVRQPEKAIEEIKRVLKPGGSYFFMEHVAAPRSSMFRSVQERLQVIWPALSDGCNLTREMWTYIEEAGFSTVEVKHFTMENAKLIAVVKFCISGIAVK